MYASLHNKLFGYLEKKSKGTLLLTGYLLVAMLSFLDYYTGELSFILFYLLPVFLVAWFVDKRSSLFICLSCSIASYINKLLVNHIHYSLFSHSWDFLIETIYLSLLGLMFSTLREKHEQEKKLARIDPLTRTLNRRYLYEVAEQEIYRSLRYERPFSVLYLDLDNFKNINDQKGHHVGDDLLCVVADTIMGNTRYTDYVARIGGDEFVVIFPEIGAEDAVSAVNKLQEKLSAEMERNAWPVTFSIGLVTYNIPPESVDDMLRKADDLMYSIKYEGKNGLRHMIINEGQRLIRNVPKSKSWLKMGNLQFAQDLKAKFPPVVYLRNRRLRGKNRKESPQLSID